MADTKNVEYEAAKFLEKLFCDSTDAPKLASKLTVILEYMRASGKQNSLPYQIISRALGILCGSGSDVTDTHALRNKQNDIVPFAHANDGVDPGCEKAHHVSDNKQAEQQPSEDRSVKTKRPTREDNEPHLEKKTTIEATAKNLGVSESTLKHAQRGLRRESWPLKGCNPAKKQKCYVESTSKGQHSLEGCDESQSFASDNMMKGVKEITRPTQAQMCRHRESGKSGSSAREDGSSSNVIAKAKYKGDTIRIVMSCISTFGELKEEVARKLNLDMNKFKYSIWMLTKNGY